MAAIPIAMGPRGRIRVQSPRRLVGPLATATNGDQESAIHVWYFRYTEIFWRLCNWLRAGAGAGERQVRLVAERYSQSVRSEAGECNEGDACVYIEGEEWAGASFYRGTGRWCAEVLVACFGFSFLSFSFSLLSNTQVTHYIMFMSSCNPFLLSTCIRIVVPSLLIIHVTSHHDSL